MKKSTLKEVNTQKEKNGNIKISNNVFSGQVDLKEICKINHQQNDFFF